MYAIALHTLSMPRVIIKLGALVRFMKIPLIAPQVPPTRQLTNNAINGGTAEFWINNAHTVEESAITEATDRSIPPLAITKVCPNARIPTTADAEIIFSRFENDKK